MITTSKWNKKNKILQAIVENDPVSFCVEQINLQHIEMSEKNANENTYQYAFICNTNFFHIFIHAGLMYTYFC